MFYALNTGATAIRMRTGSPRCPAFGSLVADAATCDRRDAVRLRTMQEATRDIASFFAPHVRESHPCKDLDGRRLRRPWTEPDADEVTVAPHHVNLFALLDDVFLREDSGARLGQSATPLGGAH